MVFYALHGIDTVCVYTCIQKICVWWLILSKPDSALGTSRELSTTLAKCHSGVSHNSATDCYSSDRRASVKMEILWAGSRFSHIQYFRHLPLLGNCRTSFLINCGKTGSKELRKEVKERSTEPNREELKHIQMGEREQFESNAFLHHNIVALLNAGSTHSPTPCRLQVISGSFWVC